MKTTPVHVLAASLSFAACYRAAPPRPASIPLPPPTPGAEIVVDSRTETTFERVQKKAYSCPFGHAKGSPDCTVTTYDVTEPITRTTSAATYGGQPITFGQLKVMADPEYDRKVERLAELARTCKRADVPRYVGIGLLLGGFVAAVAGKEGPLGTAGKFAMLGGAGSYALGYVALGGRTCNTARDLYRELDLSQERTWTTVQGDDHASEMRALAERFNRTRAATAMQMR